MEIIKLIKTVNGLKINYEEKGEGDLIVLLHGWGSNITLFAKEDSPAEISSTVAPSF